MRASDSIDIHNIKANIEQARRTSDKLVGIGPIGIGLDGILTWIPGVGELYTLGAGAYLLTQGVKARVSGIVLWQMSALLMVDLVLGAVPAAGDIGDMLFCAHLWAGGLLKRAIDKTAYIDGGPDDGGPSAPVQAAMAAGKRIVFFAKA